MLHEIIFRLKQILYDYTNLGMLRGIFRSRKYFLNSLTAVLFILLFVFACTPQKKVIYFQGNFNALNDSSAVGYFKLKINPGDILLVNIFTINHEAFPYFNSVTDHAVSDIRSPYEKGFVVNEHGAIQIPLAGDVTVQNLSMTEAAAAVHDKLLRFIDDPIVTVKKLNFKVTVLGEVARPGTFNIYNESATLLEVLGLAGDINAFGNKTSVKIIRNDSKTPRVLLVDMTNASSLTMENYLLHPDDVVYVEPVRRRALQNITPEITVLASILTTAVVVLSFILTKK